MQKTVRPIRTGEEYIESLKGRNLKVYLFGEPRECAGVLEKRKSYPVCVLIKDKVMHNKVVRASYP